MKKELKLEKVGASGTRHTIQDDICEISSNFNHFCACNGVASEARRANHSDSYEIPTKGWSMQLGLENPGYFQNAISPEPLELFHRVKKQIKGHSISY